MPKRVHLPDGRIVNFPDSMTPQAIQAAMVKLSGGQAEPSAQAPPARTWMDTASDVAGGVRASAAQTVYGGGDLIRRGWNAVVPESMATERVIDRPDVQAAMTAPESTAGTVGKLIGDAAQYAVPLARVSKAVKGSGILTRATAEGAASAGVAGLQSAGDPTEMGMAAAGGAVLPFAAKAVGAVGRTAQRAAAGAKEGGVGGAIAGAVRTVAPSDARTMVFQAIKPTSARTNFAVTLDRALPEIKAAEQAIGKPIDSLDTMLEATKAAKTGIQQQLDQMRGAQRAIGAEVDLSSVADAMVKAIPRKIQLLDRDATKKLREAASVYRQRFSLDDAEQMLRETNAELDGFYAMYPHAQRAKLAANPQVASLEAQATALRSAIYRTLDDPGQGQAARELNRRWGAINEVEREALRRSNVAKRQQPESLSEQIGAVRAAADTARGVWRLMHGDMFGAADIAAAKAGRSTATFLKEQQTADALIRRAFAGYKSKPSPVVMPQARPVRGALPPGSIVTPPPADASFVRSVPAVPVQNQRLALPPARPTTHMGPGRDPSGVTSVPAGRTVQRNPRTGRMQRVYTGEGR